MITAVSTWDGELPDDDTLADPDAFRRWFDGWVKEQRDRRPGDDDAEVHGFRVTE